MSHREEPLCGLLVPSLPSVSLLFSSWPAGQESFVEGTRKRSGWTCLDTPPLWTSRQTLHTARDRQEAWYGAGSEFRCM